MVIKRYAGLLTLDPVALKKNTLKFSLESISTHIGDKHLKATISLFTYQEKSESKSQKIRFSFFNQVGDNFPLFCGTGSSNLIGGEHLGGGCFTLYGNTNKDVSASVRLTMIGQWQELKTMQLYLMRANLKFVEN